MSRIAIAGSNGLAGNALVHKLQLQGHQVVRLVRSLSPDPGGTAGDIRQSLWNPERESIEPEALAGCDAVVNLSGEPVAGRWTNSVKTRISESRILSTRLLARECARNRIPLLLNASAIGIYGNRCDQLLDETSPCGGGFLADTCVAWEHALRPARDAGVRTVALRFGMILSRSGGALPRMLPAFRAGLGGPLGSGRQWVSWIHLSDAIGAIEHAIRNVRISGPVLVTSPHPVRQAEFAANLGERFHRIARIPLPPWLLHLVFGAMAEEILLASQKCAPVRLGETGFSWAFPELAQALSDLIP